MTRFGMAVMCGPAFVLSVFVGLTQGNPLAWGLAIGFAAPVVGTFLLVVPARPAPRKADPAKIARLERELGIGPEPPDLARTHAATMAEWDAVTSEAPTTPLDARTWDPATFHGAPTFGHKIEGP